GAEPVGRARRVDAIYQELHRALQERIFDRSQALFQREDAVPAGYTGELNDLLHQGADVALLLPDGPTCHLEAAHEVPEGKRDGRRAERATEDDDARG